MRVRSAVRRMCRDCYVVKKKRVVYIRCKSIKKHKQRQGFHTEAGVSTWDGEWQGSHTHGFGACSCCEDRTRLATASPWTADPLRNASGDPSGVLVSLPWLPAWASVPPAAVGSKAATPPVVTAVSPLRMLGNWLGSSLLSAVRRSGP